MTNRRRTTKKTEELTPVGGDGSGIQIGPGRLDQTVNDPLRTHNERRGETGLRNAKYEGIGRSRTQADQSERVMTNHIGPEDVEE